MSKYVNIAAYHFAELDALDERRATLRALCKREGLCGTILLSPEGINLFVGGSRAGIDALLAALRSDPRLAELQSKESLSERQPFRRMLVKIKREIIPFGREVEVGNAPRLPPAELKRWLDEGRPVHLLDTRNHFEVQLGTFRGARDPNIESFRDFPDAIDSLRAELRGAPIVTFCTGGIRCEKAAPYLLAQGFQDVWQLDGGILKYFEECGGDHYDGECFVFDQRVAVDPRLAETDTIQCFACQHPLTSEEQRSPLFAEGQSCPHCYVDDATARARLVEARNARLREFLRVLPGSEPADNERPLHVGARHDGRRLGEVLEQLHPHVTDWRDRTAAGRLRRRGERLDWDTRLRAGDVVVHVEPAVVEPDVSAEVEILYEDDWLVAVQKPAPLPMHPSGRFNRNTLETFLRLVYAPKRLRPAHRLDANTTGVVLFSTSRRIAGLLQPQFESGTVAKRYLVEVAGSPKEEQFACDASIGRAVGPAGRRALHDDGDAAHTRFSVLERRASTTLLLASPSTGRTNQIRLHARALGLPVVGDRPYRDAHVPMTRSIDEPPMHLHAWSLELEHPATGERVTFAAAPPAWAAQSSALVAALANPSGTTNTRRSSEPILSHS